MRTVAEFPSASVRRVRAEIALGAMALAAVLGSASCGRDALAPPAGLNHTHATPRFVLYSDLEGERLAFHARWFQGFWRWFEREWYPVAPSRVLQVWLFGDPRRFVAWERAHGGSGAYGYYQVIGDQPVLSVNAATGFGTSTHELVHHFVRSVFGDSPPPWFNEGFAAFFEKFPRASAR